MTEETHVDATEVERQITARATVARGAMLAALETHVDPDSLRSTVAITATAGLLGRLLIVTLQDDPRQARWVASVLDNLCDAVRSAAAIIPAPDSTKH